MSKDTILDIIIGLKDKASGPFKALENVFHSGIERLKSAATGLAIGALGALAAAFWQLTKAVQEFAGQELGEVAMSSALKQMGQYTEAYEQKILNLANQYQKTTGVGDEMWLKAAGQLTRFGMTSKNVDQVFKALSNLTGLMDGNFDGAVMAMQRALEGEFGLFGRLGIQLDLTGDKTVDLSNLMTQLAEKGGGAMEALAGTLAGKKNTLVNSISDFREEVGRTLSESLGLKDGLQWLSEKFDALTKSATDGKLHTILTDAGTAVQNWAKQVGDIISQINDLEDLKIVAGIIGDWLKDKLIEGGQKAANFILEKAPIIGSAIAESMANYLSTEKEAEKRASQKLYGSDSPSIFSKAAWGLDPEYRQESRRQMGVVSQEQGNARGQELAAQIEISAASQQSLADKIIAALTTKASQPKNDSERLTQALENGLSGEALDKLVTGLELTAEDLELLADYIETFSTSGSDTVQSAQKVQEETIKSLEAVKASHTSVESTLRSAAAAATATAQVSAQTIQVTQQVVATVVLQGAQLSSMASDIQRINAQLRSMRA
jgi:hypothetical protein